MGFDSKLLSIKNGPVMKGERIKTKQREIENENEEKKT